MAASLFESSGDLIADRRYAFGCDLMARGDAAGAADLFAQALERAPDFVSAWFALGEARERLGQRPQAIGAFRQVLARDPADRHGASLYLMRLGATPLQEMPAEYVRTLFDQYAERFDAALVEGLAYRGPELLVAAVKAAVEAAGRPLHFACALDLGCGTGLGGAALRPLVERLTGVDISAGMVEQARAKQIYDRLAVADLVPFIDAQPPAAYDLLFAADVFVYFADLVPLVSAAGRALVPDGLLAFSVESHAGDGVILGAKLRYAHAGAHVRMALSTAGLTLLRLDRAATRTEGGQPVPGLIAVAQRG